MPRAGGPIATKTALRPCPICGAVAVEVLHTQRFALPAGSPLPAAYDVVACPGCGFVYADTPASQEDYDRHYARFSKYEDPAVATGGGASAADRKRIGLLAARMAERVPEGARVLDVGCAGGGLLLALRERGFRNLRGVDASEACAAQVRATGIPAESVPLSALGTLGRAGPFDLIILSHVLEHVRDLGSAVGVAATLLAQAGTVYFETPDASSYDDHPFVPWYFFDPEHINHFDTARLAALGRRHGLLAVEADEGTLELADGRPYPVCRAFLRHDQSIRDEEPSAGTSALRDRIADYVEACRSAAVFPELSRFAASGRPMILWGAGSFAQRLFGEGSLDGCNVVAVVDRDRNKQGRSLAGFTVEAPEAALARPGDSVIVVAAAIAPAAVVEEAKRLLPGRDVIALATRPLPGRSGAE